MENFSPVSLGFAEFVSQLIQETFEATLSAQNYQIEKYTELVNSLSLSDERFKEMYLSDDSLVEKELNIFDVIIVAKMSVKEDLFNIIEEIFETTKGIVYQKRLTIDGAKKLKEYVLDSLITERKNILETVINKSEMARLIVDSGEIKAKLELKNFYQNINNISGIRSAESTEPVVIPRPMKPIDPVELTGISIDLGEVTIQEISDPVSNTTTIIVDKDSIQQPISSIPNVRIIATPASITSSSNLFSEVTIKFKTV